MTNNIIRTFLFSLSILILLSSCQRGGTSWDTDITTPIFKTSFGINNLIADSLLSKNPDSSLSLVYKSSLYNLAFDSLIHIPDTTIKYAYVLPLPTYTFNCGQPITPSPPANTTQTTYPLHGVGLKTAILRSGIMGVNILNKVRKRIKIQYQIPSATFNGTSFKIVAWVDGRVGNTPGHLYTEYDLSGYTIDMSGPAHNSINTVVTSVDAWIDPSLPATDTVNVTNFDALEINSSFQKMVPEYAKGYFGQTVQNVGPSENSFPIFSKITSGSLKLQSVTLQFHVENGIGADARIMIPDIYSRNTKNGSTVHLSGPIINNPINLNRAIETFSTPPVTPSFYSVSLNNSNSNIKALIENLPDKIGYQLGIYPNPLGNVSGFNDFVFYGYGINAGLDLTIPLSVVANNLTLADTLPVNFDKVSSNVDRLHKCNLTLYSANGFPFTANVQLYTVDLYNSVSDSLIGSNTLIDEAPVDMNYKAIDQRQTILQIPVPSMKVFHLIHAKKLIIVAKFNTSSKPNFIKIYDDYRIDFRLSGDFNYTIKLH
jgi:hypothetical protein